MLVRGYKKKERREEKKTHFWIGSWKEKKENFDLKKEN